MWFWFEGMVDLFFYIDLVLNFFTAFEVQGAPCTGVLQPEGSCQTAEL